MWSCGCVVKDGRGVPTRGGLSGSGIREGLKTDAGGGVVLSLGFGERTEAKLGWRVDLNSKSGRKRKLELELQSSSDDADGDEAEEFVPEEQTSESSPVLSTRVLRAPGAIKGARKAILPETGV